MTKTIEIGKEYVVGYWYKGGFVPTLCNGQYNPEHPCRVKTTKIGKKYAYAFMTGDVKNPTKIEFAGLEEVQAAKAGYRQALEDRDAMWTKTGATCMLGKAKIDQLVNNL